MKMKKIKKMNRPLLDLSASPQVKICSPCLRVIATALAESRMVTLVGQYSSRDQAYTGPQLFNTLLTRMARPNKAKLMHSVVITSVNGLRETVPTLKENSCMLRLPIYHGFVQPCRT